jgi:hypothetical protein
MSTPAGRPCRVITISSRAANRKYFERSSFTCASATAWTRRSFLREPTLRLLLGDDGKDFDRRFCNVIEHHDVADPQSVLRLAEAAQPLHATFADFRRFVSEVAVDRVLDQRSLVAGQLPKHASGLWSQDDVERHFWLNDSQNFYDKAICCFRGGLTVGFSRGGS